MDYLPLFFDVKNKPCLIVGGGSIATRKARLLAKAEAVIIVVAPKIEDELQRLVQQSGGACFFEGYQQRFIESKVLVISATDNRQLNEQVSKDCQQRNLPVNVVDSPDLCSVITPAIVDRSPLIIGISSGGEAPVLARRIRSHLDATLPAAYGQLAQLASRFRNKVKQAFSDGEQRRRFWESVINGDIAEQVFSGNTGKAEQLLEERISHSQCDTSGEVYLVGAGPGDPDLLTFKALRLMQQAEVVLYDRLVSEPILEMVRRDAERIYVGKKRSEHSMAQQDINQLLLTLAQQGKRVLRLKGGDPFIFGRGGEEIDLLAENNIRFQVVPGITAASGCAAYAGIPLTHRDHSQSVRFITGHLKDGDVNFNWQEFVDSRQTLVFYMGLKGLEQICTKLIQYGKSADTPAALVERGTLPQQVVHSGTLASLPALIATREVHAPTLLIIGDVVKLQAKLSWYKSDQSSS
ncbi:siroheme synthase CysG [Teredinibacter haidensis]|uniref:siroheme synthase CysG n=1 Tax=Teredinibacter haidensis TaxID=2731755 RepID=UPI000948E2EB|nr:siroheme synthase CysG [Teredinibacter haidensis]